MTERILPPIGRWTGKVIDHDVGRSGKGETPTAWILFSFQDASDVTHEVQCYLYFSEKTIALEHGPLKQLRELGFDLEASGWAFEKLGKKSDANPSGGALMGLEADITVERDEHNGKVKHEVAWINKPGTGAAGLKDRANTPEKLKELAGYVRSLASGSAAPRPSTAAATREKAEVASGKSAPAAAPKSGKPADDLPF